MKTLLGLATLVLLAGCKVAATAEDYRWKVKAPDKVADGPAARLHFSVETLAQDGTPVHGVPYVWKVEWAGVEGIRHQGYSFDPESIRVKGGPGTAQLLVLAFDRGHAMVEVARVSFEVTPSDPPIK